MRKVLQFVGPTHNSDGQESANHAQHMGALSLHKTNDHGRALRRMLEGWEDYATAYRKAYGSPVGDDGVIGDYWAEVGLTIKRLLDGETGGLDCGSIASNITEMILAEGISTDGYSVKR